MEKLIAIIGIVFCSSLTQGQSLVKKEKLDSLTLFFEFGSSSYPAKQAVISRINRLGKINDVHVEVRGYTDTVGNLQYNEKLAALRVKEAISILKRTRFRTAFIDTFNYNESHPDSNINDEAYRRVDLVFYQVKNAFELNRPLSLQINFWSSTDRYIHGSEKTLAELATILHADPTLKIRLYGHVCCEPDMDLSYRRAAKVRSYLVRNGIDAKRIECRGFSNTQKLVPEITDEDMRRNMRVEVIFYRD